MPRSPGSDPLHSFTLADLAGEHRRSHPLGAAVVDGSTRLSWPQLDDRVHRLANALVNHGVEPGDRVLWLAQNSGGILECLLAAARLGAVLAIANWRQSPEEFAFVIADADAKVAIWQQAEVGEAVTAGRRMAVERAGEAAVSTAEATTWLQLDADGADSYEAFVATGGTEPVARVARSSDPVLLLWTAAFTGTPNGALLSHDAILTQSLIMANLQRIDADYRYLNSGPMFHVATLMTTLATLLCGGTNVFVPRTNAEDMCRVIEAEGCTGAFLMGPTIGEMVELNADGRYDLSTLRAIGGSSRWNEMITVDDSPWARHPAGFGQTEVMGLLTFNALGVDATGNSGRPAPMVAVRIMDPEGNEVPTGETGEICARGPQVMVGYHDRADETQRRQRGGWHHTGDLGRREADGSISFIGPMGRLIKSGAENIYPAEVEAALVAHDDVAEAAVIGVPDQQWGQSVTAIVVPVAGASPEPDELITWVRERIASYKKPRHVEIRTEPLPRLGFPIDYDQLDTDYGGGGYPGAG